MAFLNAVFRLFLIVMITATVSSTYAATEAGMVRVKDIARVKGVRDNNLIGYGLVTGLAGTGDSSRNQATVQSISNALRKFGMILDAADIRSRNVAAVMLTATLPPFSEPGDKLDVNITSLGDARSLSGGTLLLTDLRGPDQKVYALAQGALSVGGYSFELNGNVQQKNHPTSAIVSGGATVEVPLNSSLVDENGKFQLLLNEPDITTMIRLVDAVNTHLGSELAHAETPGKVLIEVPAERKNDWLRVIMEVENLTVTPDTIARVVINEKTGTVISGGNARIDQVSITHGDLKISITNETKVYSDLISIGDDDTVVIPDSGLAIEEGNSIQLNTKQSSSVSDLILALNQINATSREIITILQSLKRAGALHAELIVQ